MSANASSSSLNASLSPQSLSPSNCTVQPAQCLASMLVLQVVSIVLLLPTSTYILYLGFQRWRTRHSSSTTMSHTDFFTYNMAVTDLFGVVGNIIYLCEDQTCLTNVSLVVHYTRSFLWLGRMMFPTLTCWERYLAVVHPIIYRRMKQRLGIRIRNVCIVNIWSQAIFWSVLVMQIFLYNLMPFMIACGIQVCVFLILMLFCSLSVLYVLIRPRPGEMGGDKMHIKQSKQRAFRTIVIIMGVLSLKFGGSFVAIVFSSSMPLRFSCVNDLAQEWSALPSSLVLPLLFLRQHGKLPGCKH